MRTFKPLPLFPPPPPPAVLGSRNPPPDKPTHSKDSNEDDLNNRKDISHDTDNSRSKNLDDLEATSKDAGTTDGVVEDWVSKDYDEESGIGRVDVA